MNDLARYIVAAEMLALVLAVSGMLGVYHDQATNLPCAVKWLIGVVMWVLTGGAAAVIINVLSAEESTHGARFLGAFLAPAAVAAVAAVVHSAIRPRPEPYTQRVILNAATIARSVEHLAHLEPCPNPDCVRVRRELAALAGIPA